MKEKKEPMIRTDQKKKSPRQTKGKQTSDRAKEISKDKGMKDIFFWWAGWSAVDGESG